MPFPPLKLLPHEGQCVCLNVGIYFNNFNNIIRFLHSGYYTSQMTWKIISSEIFLCSFFLLPLWKALNAQTGLCNSTKKIRCNVVSLERICGFFIYYCLFFPSGFFSSFCCNCFRILTYLRRNANQSAVNVYPCLIYSSCSA